VGAVLCMGFSFRKPGSPGHFLKVDLSISRGALQTYPKFRLSMSLLRITEIVVSRAAPANTRMIISGKGEWVDHLLEPDPASMEVIVYHACNHAERSHVKREAFGVPAFLWPRAVGWW
jgi:hypothetical protein